MQLNEKQCTAMLNSVITIIRKMQFVNFMSEGSNRFDNTIESGRAWDGAQMAIFCVIFASCIFSETRAAHFRPAF